MIRRTFVVLVLIVSTCFVYSTQNAHGQDFRFGNSPGSSRTPEAPGVDPPRMRGGGGGGREHAIYDDDDDEDRYVPVAFNIDDGTNSNGNGLHNGHAIEMLAPVEVSEYGWNDASRGVSELGHGGASVQIQSPAAGTQAFADPPTHTGDLIQCGRLQIDPRHSVCCDGLVYRKTSVQDAAKCCGSVAYDDRLFTCCQGRAIVRRNGQLPLCCGDYTRDTLPDQCRPGYQNDTTGLGSTCCRSADTGAWKCCVRGQECCDRDRGTAIDVPGFRPACCHLANEDLTAQCCATTYEKVRVLPDCCRGARLTPVCCKRRDSVAVRCCPGTIGYCCGTGEIEIPPPALHHSTAPPIQPPHVTHPPRPSHSRYPPITDRPEPISGRPAAFTYPPRPTQPPFPQYTTRFPGPEHSLTEVPGAPRPSCCKSRTPQRHCCSRTKGQQCCRSSSSSSSSLSSSSLPRCCFVIYLNVTCCRNHMQQTQPIAGSRHGGGSGGVIQRSPVDVHPVNQPPATNGGHHQAGQQQQQQHHSLNGRNREGHGGGGGGGTVGHSCCGLDSSAAVACCRDGHRETGRLPSCCISSPSQSADARYVQSDSRRDVQSDDPHSPAARDQQQQQQQQRNETGAQVVGRCSGVPFDAEESICCGDRLRRRIGVRPACCLSVAYDSLLYKCCDGNVRLSCRAEYRPKKSLWGVHI